MSFQSPASNYTEQRLDFTNLVRLSPQSSYVIRSGSEYPSAGILKGSLLAVDKSLEPVHGSIVIAEINDEFTIRRLLLVPSPALQELEGEQRITSISKQDDLPLWGVVAYVLSDVAGIGFNDATD